MGTLLGIYWGIGDFGGIEGIEGNQSGARCQVSWHLDAWSMVHGMSGRRIVGLCLCVLGVGGYWV